MYSQEFLTNDSIFSDTLKYKISLPETKIDFQNMENNLKKDLKTDFDLKYALDFNTENKNRPLPYSTILKSADLQQYRDTNIFLQELTSQLKKEFEKNTFSFQKFEYQPPNFSGFQKVDLFSNSLNVNLLQNKNFFIETSRYSFHTGFEGINTAGVKLSWKPNERLKLSLQPSGGRYYYGFDVRPNYYGNINFNADYKISDRLNFLLNTNYVFAGKNTPYYAQDIYPKNDIYAGIQIRLTSWLSIQGGVDAYKQLNGGVRLLPVIMPIIDFGKLLGLFKKKKSKKVIPLYWY